MEFTKRQKIRKLEQVNETKEELIPDGPWAQRTQEGEREGLEMVILKRNKSSVIATNDEEEFRKMSFPKKKSEKELTVNNINTITIGIMFNFLLSSNCLKL